MTRRTFTLIEIVISIGILSVIGLILIQFVRGGYSIFWRGQVSSGIRMESDAIASRLANALRGSFEVQDAQNTSLTTLSYFAPADATPTKVTITQTGNNLILTTIPGVFVNDRYVYNPNTATTRTISSHLVMTGSAVPIFKYYDESGTQLMPPYDVKGVHVIEIVATVFSPLETTRTATASTKVQLRNLKTNL